MNAIAPYFSQMWMWAAGACVAALLGGVPELWPVTLLADHVPSPYMVCGVHVLLLLMLNSN